MTVKVKGTRYVWSKEKALRNLGKIAKYTMIVTITTVIFTVSASKVHSSDVLPYQTYEQAMTYWDNSEGVR